MARFGEQTEAIDGEDYVLALQSTAPDTWGIGFQAADRISDELLRFIRAVQFPGLGWAAPRSAQR